MTSMQPHPITHACRSCGRHFALHQVRQVHPCRAHLKVRQRSWYARSAAATTSILLEVPNAG
jgi:hypothetical protein